MKIKHQLWDEGVEYVLDDRAGILVKGNPEGYASVFLRVEGENVTVVERGPLTSAKFRERVIKSAEKAFGEVNGFAKGLDYAAANYAEHSKEREQAAKEDHDRRTVPEFEDTPYDITGGGFVKLIYTQEGERQVPLTNWTAKIVRDVTEDDGAERIRYFEIRARRGKDKKFTFEVPAFDFAAMRWVHDRMGAATIVYPGAKEHIPVCIQTLSGEPEKVTVYGHTGWRVVRGERVYLHAGGAVGACGGQFSGDAGQEIGQFGHFASGKMTSENPHYDAEKSTSGQFGQFSGPYVRLPDADSLRVLPAPPGGAERKEAIRASLRVTDPSLGAEEVAVPLIAAAYRAPLDDTDFSVHVTGRTGLGKSELAALSQQHFAPKLNARKLTSWEGTANALEMQAFTLKDQVLVIDDFSPQGSESEVRQWHRKADRLLRAKGNQAGRNRLRRDSTRMPEKPPRALIVSTGEDVPAGQSLRARLLVCEQLQEVSWEVLTERQEEAASGLYAAAMSGYIAYLARVHPDLPERLQEERDERRAEFHTEGRHRRTSTMIADLFLGLSYFLDYAVYAGVLTKEEAAAKENRWREVLSQAAAAQDHYQAEADPIRRFASLLTDALISGKAHVTEDNATETGVPGDEPRGWGWRCDQTGDGSDVWRPRGERVGWIVEGTDDLYILPDAALKVARTQAGGGADMLAMSKGALGKMLRDKNNLLSTGEQEGRSTALVRMTFDKQRASYWHLSRNFVGGAQE